MTDTLKDAAAEIRRRITEGVAAVKARPEMTEVMTALQALNGLEDLMNEPRSTLGEFFGILVAEQASSSVSEPSGVRFDEFFGLKPLDAAKTYLKKRSDARPFQEIVDALKSGGCKLESEDKLREGLSRSTLDVVKIGDRYGWLDHYPDEKTKRWKGFRKIVLSDEVKTGDSATVKIGEATGSKKEEGES